MRGHTQHTACLNKRRYYHDLRATSCRIDAGARAPQKGCLEGYLETKEKKMVICLASALRAR